MKAFNSDNHVHLKTVTGCLQDSDRNTRCESNVYEYPVVSDSKRLLPGVPLTMKTRLATVSAVCLGLLCVLLLAGIIGLWFYHTEEENKWDKRLFDLQTSYNNLTQENRQLQTSYNNLNKERDQLQTSYNNLANDKNQLQTSYNNLTKDKNQLQISYNNLTKDKDQLQTSYNNLTRDKTQLQTSYNSLTRDRDFLRISYNNLAKERDQLQTSYNTATTRITELQREVQRLAPLARSCPVGWGKFGSSCYLISYGSKTWQESSNDCAAKGARLVIINSREEQAFVSAQTNNQRVWIGLYDPYGNRNFRWVDGSSLTTGYWLSGQPNNYNGTQQSCVEIYIFGEPFNGWNDLSCSFRSKWVCEL